MIRPVLILTVYCLLFSLNLVAQENPERQWEDKNFSFEEFVTTAESLYKVRFFYRDEWIKDIHPVVSRGSYSLPELLNGLFRGTDLYYFADSEGNLIITKQFSIKIPGFNEKAESNIIQLPHYSENKDEGQSSGNVFITIGNPADKNKPGKVIVSGYIVDRDTREPVAGATVFVAKHSAGTASNEYGFYSLSLPRGTHSVKYSFIGMKDKIVNINLYGSGEHDVAMNNTVIPLKETIISAERNVVFQRFEVGVEKINISSFRLLPTSLGESDIFKSILLIPGVQSVGEGSTGFNVRGGSADQNLILLYGAPVYNSSHFFGFFSAVNSDMIKDVTLYKGGIPAKYGGRISSVLDISAKEGNRKEFDGSAGIGPLTTHLMVEGPLIKDVSSFMLSGRTTYSNWILNLFDNPALKNSQASFSDLNGTITYNPSKKDKIDLSSYFSHDAFRLNSDTDYSYNNRVLAVKWRHFFRSQFFSSITLSNSNYNYDISSQTNLSEGFLLSHRINSTCLKADLNLFEGRNQLNFGFDGTRYIVSPGSYQPYGDSSLVIPETIDREKALEAALYIEDKFIVNDFLSINAGLRYSSFFTFGPNSVLIYDPSFSKRPTTVIDTLHYKSNELIKNYGGPEIRLALNFTLSRTSSLKLNYNRTRQYLHLLSNTTSISPSDTWKLSDYYLKPQVGDQYAIGFYQVLFDGIEASAEIYYKQIRNMADYKAGTKLIMNEDIEQDLVNVRGKAYGMELMVRKSEGRFRWSVAYAYARTFLKSTGRFNDEIINSGAWFPASFDKPNDLTSTLNFIYSRRISFSANYIWSTGRPVTYPVTSYRFNDLLLISYSDRNKYRIPYYARLDISLRLNGTLKSGKLLHPFWTFSLYNLLGRENVYTVYFKNEKNTINGYKLSVFGRTIPSVTYSFDF